MGKILQENQYVLGIEGTAHTCGIGIVDSSNNIIGEARSTFSPKTGGIHPRESSQFISNILPKMLKKAIDKADVKLTEISAVAFSQGPGLGPCLRATATGARAFSLAIKRPLIGVNHALAHIELGIELCHIESPLILYTSGWNTQLISYADHQYHILGETQDIAIGNCIDTVARAIGYDYALAGPIVEQEAKKGTKLLNLPYSVKGTSLSYSGLATSAIRQYTEYHEEPYNICYSLQEIGFAMLAEVTEKALILSGEKTLLLTGGVAANERLQKMLQDVAEENNAHLASVPKNLAGDNGVKIAIAGRKFWEAQISTSIPESYIKPRWRIDDIYIPW